MEEGSVSPSGEDQEEASLVSGVDVPEPEEEEVENLKEDQGEDNEADKGGDVEVEEEGEEEEDKAPVRGGSVEPDEDASHAQSQRNEPDQVSEAASEHAQEKQGGSAVELQQAPEAQENPAQPEEQGTPGEKLNLDVFRADVRKTDSGEERQCNGSRKGSNQSSGKRKQSLKYLKAYPFRARETDEKEILRAINETPPKHQYFGYIFSADTPRPSGYFKRYFLPLVGQPTPRQHVQLIGHRIPSEKIVSSNEAPMNLMPLSTVKVQWGIRHHATNFTMDGVYAYMCRFGCIDVVYSLTTNSALVVFSTLKAAYEAVHCPELGSPWDTLIATWQEPRMANRDFFSKYAMLESTDIGYDKMTSQT